MVNTEQQIKISISHCKTELLVNYAPKTTRVFYDICDTNGRILKTGSMSEFDVRINISELSNSKYVLLILDGDRIRNQGFTIDR